MERWRKGYYLKLHSNYCDKLVPHFCRISQQCQSMSQVFPKSCWKGFLPHQCNKSLQHPSGFKHQQKSNTDLNVTPCESHEELIVYSPSTNYKSWFPICRVTLLSNLTIGSTCIAVLVSRKSNPGAAIFAIHFNWTSVIYNSYLNIMPSKSTQCPSNKSMWCCNKITQSDLSNKVPHHVSYPR